MLVATAIALLALGWQQPFDPPPAERSAEPRVERVNVLLVVTDDTGLDMVGCYGSPDAAPTPNIDALAAGGCRFDAAFANPYCSPTRAQLLTGRHGHRTGIGSNVPHASAYGLPTQELALPTALAPHGYSTGAFGKWHLLSLPAQGPLHPNLMGFETFAGSAGNLKQRLNGPNNGSYYGWELLEDGQTTDLFDEYATTKVTDLAIEWCGTAPEPWFAYVAYHAAHGPWHYPPDELHTRDLQGEPDDDKPLFARAALEACDTEIGRLVASVRQSAQESVLVILLGDNGTDGDSVLPPLRPDHAKGTLHDGGTRIPLLVNGPGIPAGRTVERLVCATDVFATVLHAAGVPIPSGVADDSLSFLGLAEGSDYAPTREYVYGEIFEPNGPTGVKTTYDRMLRDLRWKLIRHKTRPDELYYLPDDPLEEHDLLLGALSPEALAAYVRLQRELPEVQYH